MEYWDKGWEALNSALLQVNDDNINSAIFIRGEQHSVLDALLRQLAHYPYHIGQMVYVAKILKNHRWQTLSIARNKSEDFNRHMFAKETGSGFPDLSSPLCFSKSEEVRDEYKDEHGTDSA